jgi:putative flippase GtrA
VSAPGELARFGAVGVLSNVLLYFLYLAATALGTGHKSAMTLAYCIGVVQSFYLNRSWTFRHEGLARTALARYWAAYLAAYGLNLVLLLVLVDMAGLQHQLVQAVLTAVIAMLMFLTQKFWVFRIPSAP